jgi:hypothetical protein
VKTLAGMHIPVFFTENSKGNPCCAENFIKSKENSYKDIYRVFDPQPRIYSCFSFLEDCEPYMFFLYIYFFVMFQPLMMQWMTLFDNLKEFQMV